jgi:hypothetical protein
MRSNATLYLLAAAQSFVMLRRYRRLEYWRERQTYVGGLPRLPDATALEQGA